MFQLRELRTSFPLRGTKLTDMFSVLNSQRERQESTTTSFPGYKPHLVGVYQGVRQLCSLGNFFSMVIAIRGKNEHVQTHLGWFSG